MSVFSLPFLTLLQPVNILPEAFACKSKDWGYVLSKISISYQNNCW